MELKTFSSTQYPESVYRVTDSDARKRRTPREHSHTLLYFVVYLDHLEPAFKHALLL